MGGLFALSLFFLFFSPLSFNMTGASIDEANKIYVETNETINLNGTLYDVKNCINLMDGSGRKACKIIKSLKVNAGELKTKNAKIK